MTKIKVYPGFSGSQEFYERNLGGRNIFRRTNLYQLLGVKDGEKKRVSILKAYQQKSLLSHPDKVPGASREEWEKVETAYNILVNGEDNRIYHDYYFVKRWWKAGENEVDNFGEYGQELADYFREKFQFNAMGGYYIQQRLTSDLHDWEDQLKNHTRTKTIGMINSYCQRLIAVRSSIMQLEAKASEEQVPTRAPIHQIVQKFEGLQSKTEIESKFSQMGEWIEKQADNSAGIKTKFKTRRVGKRKIQNLPDWNLLDNSEKQVFLNQVENIRENYELTNIVEEVKKKIRKK